MPVVSANCRLALSSRLQKYRLFTRKEFVSFLVGDRNENESGGKEGITRSSGNDVELSPVKRSNYSTLPLVSLKCPLPRLLFSIHRPVTCHTRTQVEGPSRLIDQSRFRWSGRKCPVWQEVPGPRAVSHVDRANSGPSSAVGPVSLQRQNSSDLLSCTG